MTRSRIAFQLGSMFAPSLCVIFFACLAGCATDSLHKDRRIPRDTSRDPLVANESETASAQAVAPASHTANISRQAPEQPESYAVARTPSTLGPQYVDPAAPVTGSPYQTVGHRRVVGGAASGSANATFESNGSVAECQPSGSCVHGPYRPLFPNRLGTGLLACKAGCKVPHQGPCPQGACEPECEMPSRCMDPQEYIFDGGDRDPPVRLRSDLSQVGLDPEDTVIQYTTKTGMTEVQAGCRVAIYAPRFGSVRKRTGVLESELALRPQSADLPAGPGMIKEKLPPIQVMAPVKANTKDTVRVVEAFLDRQRPMPAELVLPMGEISDAFKPYEDLDIIRNGNILMTDPAKLAISAAAARIWSNIDALQVLIDGQEAVVIVDQKQPREFTLYEYKGARVRICKVASEQIANPGDIISFTIRYDNIGEQPVSKLVVTDSLAPRLEYVESSQQSSLEARFSTTPNEAGSSVLRWEIDRELKPGEGGFVRFDAKVR
ncbi:MAG: hypothetical protein RLZZ396_2672 [Planctomycetota bacterium]